MRFTHGVIFLSFTLYERKWRSFPLPAPIYVIRSSGDLHTSGREVAMCSVPRAPLSLFDTLNDADVYVVEGVKKCPLLGEARGLRRPQAVRHLSGVVEGSYVSAIPLVRCEVEHRAYFWSLRVWQTPLPILGWWISLRIFQHGTKKGIVPNH